MRARIDAALADFSQGSAVRAFAPLTTDAFASRGVRNAVSESRPNTPIARFAPQSLFGAPIAERLSDGPFWGPARTVLPQILADHADAAVTVDSPTREAVSAGKNTYTYDAHTYHTKVPPQGIAEVLRKYLPEGGLVLDPFAGSGMTGVAARAVGCDVILNELSPAASFISNRFTSECDSGLLAAGIASVCEALSALRSDLYRTTCRECGNDTETLYTVWSYNVLCSSCDREFLLWDHCRQYGRTVRDHKILRELPCPHCSVLLNKSRLRRTTNVPVLLGYKCCTSRQVEHPLTPEDLARIERAAQSQVLKAGFFPSTPLPDGANLSQPKRHGLTSIDRFYTPRNLAAMSALWTEIHRIEDTNLAGFLAFTFTSLYQRVTRLSEFRFWGGSGNTAHFNVPFISNEANVFVTFERKGRTIRDHLESTALGYKGRAVVRTGSATDLRFLPDSSVDMVFTDPPFGSNINYSEMNFLWEAWLERFTDSTDEAIVSRPQNKDVARYGELIAESLKECYRVLRPGHWMTLVFMNSSEKVWQALREAIRESGFTVERVDIFDKQHGTFKQFVSDNTAGCDLLLHCKKAGAQELEPSPSRDEDTETGIRRFLDNRTGNVPTLPYLHVAREPEVDFRMLYSEFIGARLTSGERLVGFPTFRALALRALTPK